MTRSAYKRANIGSSDGTLGNPSADAIVVGKDVLELLSSAMYVDPLSIFREYVQNAADAIDDARRTGILDANARGEVSITLDASKRTIRILDNGCGIPVETAVQRLLSVGASCKRGTTDRGFRGIGRLAGLAYGRALIFRTRSQGDDQVLEMRWDCQRLKAALRDLDQSDDIRSVIQRIVSTVLLDGGEWPEAFFEVEIQDVIRTKRDNLLSKEQISGYLEQVAPIPFASEFRWSKQINGHLDSVRLGNLDISVNGEPSLRRPHRNRFQVSDSIADEYAEPELLTLTDMDGNVGALGWVLHHSYQGSITVRSRIAGLRLRVGNIQVGEESLLEEIFPETRFNGWAVGEIHVLDPRIVPNARRDHFEQNIHFSNLTAQLEPIARQIAKRARAASIARNQARQAELRKRQKALIESAAIEGLDELSAPQRDLFCDLKQAIDRHKLSSGGLEEVLAMLQRLSQR